MFKNSFHHTSYNFRFSLPCDITQHWLVVTDNQDNLSVPSSRVKQFLLLYTWRWTEWLSQNIA